MKIRKEIRFCIHEIRLLKYQRDMMEYSLNSYELFENMIKTKYKELKAKLNQRKMNI